MGNKSIKKKRLEKRNNKDTMNLSFQSRRKKAFSMMAESFSSDKEICEATGFSKNEVLELRKENRKAYEDYMKKTHGH